MLTKSIRESHDKRDGGTKWKKILKWKIQQEKDD
jgi:hypothetical protein